MAQRQTLLEVNILTDDSTGIYKPGEIDFGIYGGILDEVLKNNDIKKRDEIVNTLAYLIHEIYLRFFRLHKNKQTAKQGS